MTEALVPKIPDEVATVTSTDNGGRHSWWRRAFSRLDGWYNSLTGLGKRDRDKRMSNVFGEARRMTEPELTALFAGDDIIGRIIEMPAKEMTREGVSLSVPTAEQIDDDKKTPASLMSQHAETLRLMMYVREAKMWARLYGGSLILVGADDGAESFEEPLNEGAIKTLSWFRVLTRHEVHIERHYDDPAHPKFGEPMLYRILTSSADATVHPNVAAKGTNVVGFGAVIHESRFVRFDGVTTPRERKRENMGWCDSMVDRLYPVVRDFVSSYDGAAHLVQDFSQAVIKIKGLADMIAEDVDDLVMTRLTLLDMARSMVRMLPIDAELEEFERKGTPVAGLADLLDRLGNRLSMATGIPQTLLFGRSPQGLNATGESDLRIFYDNIKADQEDTLRPQLERMFHLLWLAKDGPTGGVEPADWSFEFNSLWQIAPKEAAEERRLQAEVDHIYIVDNVLRADEVRTSRFKGDKYSVHTSLSDVEDDASDNAAKVNELSLAIERLAFIGDITMVNAARRALAARLGMEEPADLTLETIGSALEVLRRREKQGEAAGRNAGGEGKGGGGQGGSGFPSPPQRGRQVVDASTYGGIQGESKPPNLRMAILTANGHGSERCGTCGWYRDGVCNLFDEVVEPGQVCDTWSAVTPDVLKE